MLFVHIKSEYLFKCCQELLSYVDTDIAEQENTKGDEHRYSTDEEQELIQVRYIDNSLLWSVFVNLKICRFCYVNARVFIPGHPFPGRPGILVILRSGIPGNGAASFPAKTATVQLMSLLSFSIIVACSRGASSALT